MHRCAERWLVAGPAQLTIGRQRLLAAARRGHREQRPIRRGDHAALKVKAALTAAAVNHGAAVTPATNLDGNGLQYWPLGTPDAVIQSEYGSD